MFVMIKINWEQSQTISDHRTLINHLRDIQEILLPQKWTFFLSFLRKCYQLLREKSEILLNKNKIIICRCEL